MQKQSKNWPGVQYPLKRSVLLLRAGRLEIIEKITSLMINWLVLGFMELKKKRKTIFCTEVISKYHFPLIYQ